MHRRFRSSPKKRAVPVEPPVNVDTSIITTSASKSRTPWSAPMRGNNRRNLRPGHLNTGTPMGGLRRVDHFRNRPLNTSRPPSMHVDEFEKQFNDSTNGSNGASASSSSNNNNDNGSSAGGNNGNDNDLLSGMQSSNDGGSDRVSRRREGTRLSEPGDSLRIAGRAGVVRRTFAPVHYRTIGTRLCQAILVTWVSTFLIVPNRFHPSSAGGGFALRERLPYGYPSATRYP